MKERIKRWFGRVAWLAKQTLPLLYWTTYKEGGARFVCIWRMWFGRSFAIRRWRVVEENPAADNREWER